MGEGQKCQSPGGKFGLLRLQAVLFGTDGVRERPPRNSDQIPVRFSVGRLLVFDVLAPANAAVAHRIPLDLTLTLHIVHMQPFRAELSCIISPFVGRWVRISTSLEEARHYC